MGHAVAQIGDDVREVVRDAAGHRGLARFVRVEHLGVDVDRVQHDREALTQVVDVRLRTEVRLVALVGDDVLVRAETAARQQQLGHLQKEEGHGGVRLVALRHFGDGDDEALDLVRDLNHEVVRVLAGRVQRGVRHLGVVSPRRRGRV